MGSYGADATLELQIQTPAETSYCPLPASPPALLYRALPGRGGTRREQRILDGPLGQSEAPEELGGTPRPPLPTPPGPCVRAHANTAEHTRGSGVTGGFGVRDFAGVVVFWFFGGGFCRLRGARRVGWVGTGHVARGVLGTPVPRDAGSCTRALPPPSPLLPRAPPPSNGEPQKPPRAPHGDSPPSRGTKPWRGAGPRPPTPRASLGRSPGASPEGPQPQSPCKNHRHPKPLPQRRSLCVFSPFLSLFPFALPLRARSPLSPPGTAPRPFPHLKEPRWLEKAKAPGQ